MWFPLKNDHVGCKKKFWIFSEFSLISPAEKLNFVIIRSYSNASTIFRIPSFHSRFRKTHWIYHHYVMFCTMVLWWVLLPVVSVTRGQYFKNHRLINCHTWPLEEKLTFFRLHQMISFSKVSKYQLPLREFWHVIK